MNKAAPILSMLLDFSVPALSMIYISLYLLKRISITCLAKNDL